MGPYVISIDLGNLGVKAAIFDIDGEQLGTAFGELKLITARPGWVEQDPNEFYERSVLLVRQLLKRSGVRRKDIVALGISGRMSGFVPVDRKGNAIGNFQMSMDARSNEEAKALMSRHGKSIWHITGNPAQATFHAPKIIWMKKHQQNVFEKTHKFMSANGYLNLRLAGPSKTVFSIDYTMLPTTMLYDQAKLDWSEELLDLFRIPRDKMPDVTDPWAVIGDLTYDASRRMNLPPGVQLIAGVGDFPAAVLGMGVTSPGKAVDVCGTANALATCTNRPRTDTKYRTLECWKAILPEMWFLLGVVDVGLGLRWFRDKLCLQDERKARKSDFSYRSLDNAAAKASGASDGLFFVPYLTGRRDPWKPNCRASWFGLRLDHNRTNLYRSILESSAFEYYNFMTLMRKYNLGFKEVRVSGGGARSNLWNHIKADVMGVQYLTLKQIDSACVGTAIVAAYGTGYIRDMTRSVDRWVSMSRRIMPNKETHNTYLKHFRMYRKIIRTELPSSR